MMMSYGHAVESKDDRFITIAEKGVQTIEAAGAIGAHIVDFLPWRAFHCLVRNSQRLITHYITVRFIPDWFPGARIKRLPPGTREDLHAFLHTPFNQVKEQMVTDQSDFLLRND